MPSSSIHQQKLHLRSLKHHHSFPTPDQYKPNLTLFLLMIPDHNPSGFRRSKAPIKHATVDSYFAACSIGEGAKVPKPFFPRALKGGVFIKSKSN